MPTFDPWLSFFLIWTGLSGITSATMSSFLKNYMRHSHGLD